MAQRENADSHHPLGRSGIRIERPPLHPATGPDFQRSRMGGGRTESDGCYPVSEMRNTVTIPSRPVQMEYTGRDTMNSSHGRWSTPWWGNVVATSAVEENMNIFGNRGIPNSNPDRWRENHAYDDVDAGYRAFPAGLMETDDASNHGNVPTLLSRNETVPSPPRSRFDSPLQALISEISSNDVPMDLEGNWCSKQETEIPRDHYAVQRRDDAKVNETSGGKLVFQKQQQQHQHQNLNSDNVETLDSKMESMNLETSSEKFLPLEFQPDEDGDTLLHMAVISGDLDLCCSLIDRALDCSWLLDLTNDLRQTALHLATVERRPDIIRHLLRRGAKRTVCDRRGNFPLHIACSNGHLGCVQELISTTNSHEHVAGIEITHTTNDLRRQLDEPNYEGQTCLHLAATYNNLDVVRYLVDRCKADVNQEELKRGCTILHLAVISNNFPLTQYLLQHRYAKNLLEQETYDGLTAVQMARQKDIHDLLRSAIGYPNATNCPNLTQLT